jgi:hypothetical protein
MPHSTHTRRDTDNLIANSGTAATSRSHKNVRKHHTVLWIILSLVILLIACGGYFGAKLYSEARQVQVHEQKAISLLSSFQESSSAGDVAKLQTDLPQIQRETKAARMIASGTLWNVANKIPYYGSDIATVQGMTTVIDNLSSKTIPSYLTAIDTLMTAQLNGSGGQLNLQSLLEIQSSLTKANELVNSEYKTYTELNEPHLSIVKDAYELGSSQLKQMRQVSNNITNTMTLLPAFLGADGQKTYVVASVTPAESRSSGGLVGSLGSLTTDNGTISMGNFYPNGTFLKYGAAEKTDEVADLFAGPLNFSFDIRDQAALPDFSKAAEGITQIWQRSAVASDTVDGVLMIDPVFLQQVNAISGSFAISTGVTLDGSNTAEYLQNTIYKTVPVPQQDALFGEVATHAISNLFSNLDFSKMQRLSQILPQLAKDRHFQISSTNEKTQRYFEKSGFSRAPQSSEAAPSLGIYVNQQNASKMDWYVKRTTHVTRATCNSDGSQTYHVKFSMTNTMTSQEAAEVSPYISGINLGKGNAVEKVLIYAPAGGNISDMHVSGDITDLASYTLNGHTLQMNVATLAPQKTVTYEFDVITSTAAQEELSVDQTPTATESDGISFDTLSCTIQ